MRRDDDRGVALIAVIGLGVVMMLLIATGLSVAVSGLRQADSSQDTSGATDAAYAGVQDYLARINLNSTYVRYGNTSAKFSQTSTVTMPATQNKAFLLGPSAADWATVPGSGGASRFRYEVDSSTFATSGVLRLRSTGVVGDSVRTIVASFRVRGFVDYTYFTDYEIQDPQISGVDAATCVKHAWEGRSSACPTIQFGARDNLNGRVHSNDTMVICGATFTGTVTTANPNTPLYSTSGCTSTSANVPISRAAQLPMPSTNTSMRTDARCLYTGPTRITYTSDGYMNVVSPWTVNTVGPAATCGDVTALRSTGGARVAQLDSDLLYVQSVPGEVGNPNYWAAAAKPTGVTCLDANANATTDGNGPGWSFTTAGTTIRYPLAGEYPASNWKSGVQWSTTTPAYGCRNGDLYVQGRVATATTAASENYVYVTGDIITPDRTKNVLGLVGQNAVLVYNPLNVGNQSLIGGTDREIDAAMLSVAHTFQVQNYDDGPARGTLTVFGSIAQKFRGTVATLSGTTLSTGYAKAYSYNPLLAQISPPKFLSPSAVSFQLQRYAAVSAAFKTDGSQP